MASRGLVANPEPHRASYPSPLTRCPVPSGPASRDRPVGKEHRMDITRASRIIALAAAAIFVVAACSSGDSPATQVPEAVDSPAAVTAVPGAGDDANPDDQAVASPAA